MLSPVWTPQELTIIHENQTKAMDVAINALARIASDLSQERLRHEDAQKAVAEARQAIDKISVILSKNPKSKYARGKEAKWTRH